MVEASPRKIFANAHTYHVNSISVNSDDETYLSADDLRINLWSLSRTDQSFSIFSYLINCFYYLTNTQKHLIPAYPNTSPTFFPILKFFK